MHGNLASPKKHEPRGESDSLAVDDRSPKTEPQSEYARRIGASFQKSTVGEIIRVCHEISIASGRPYGEVYEAVFHGNALKSLEYHEAAAALVRYRGRPRASIRKRQFHRVAGKATC